MSERSTQGPTAEGASQTPAHISTTIEAFLAEHPHSLLLEDGRALFDLRTASYSVAAEHDRATLHLWSDDRNLVRRVLAVTPRAQTLRLTTQRFGQPRPQTLELTPDKALRAPTTRETTRQRYLRVLERALFRAFPDDSAEGLRSSMDLERSFGPAYARGTLVRGQQAWAVVAINAAESQTAIDGILTVGILWLQHCRDHAAPTASRRGRLFQGLRVVLPRGTGAATLARVPWLNSRIAQYEIFELDESTDEMTRLDPGDHGNLTTRLLQAPNEAAALERFGEAIAQVLALLPPNTPTFGLGAPTLAAAGASSASAGHHSGAAPAHRANHVLPEAPVCELRLRSNAELAFLLHGMEFARVRSDFQGQSFDRQLQITVGSGASETLLLPATRSHLRELVRHLFDRRRATPETRGGAPSTTQDPLFRGQPERWLESTLRRNLHALDAGLEPAPVYTQVPAFTGGGSNLDRGMIDLLAVTRDDRLAVLELKTSEDMQLAFQGLDYWIRVRHHHRANVDVSTGLGDLQRHGYFPQTRLAARDPLLLLVAPALHIHPATETILRHLSPAVPWTLIALDERWRSQIRPIWRKRSHP